MIWFLLLFCLLFRWGYQGSPEHYQMKVNVLVLSDILWPHGLVLKARFLEWVAFSLLQGFPGASEGKHLPAMWETWVQSLGQQDFLEKEMATHSVLLPEKFHRWRSLVGYSPWGRKESDMTEQLHIHVHIQGWSSGLCKLCIGWDFCWCFSVVAVFVCFSSDGQGWMRW